MELDLQHKSSSDIDSKTHPNRRKEKKNKAIHVRENLISHQRVSLMLRQDSGHLCKSL